VGSEHAGRRFPGDSSASSYVEAIGAFCFQKFGITCNAKCRLDMNLAVSDGKIILEREKGVDGMIAIVKCQ